MKPVSKKTGGGIPDRKKLSETDSISSPAMWGIGLVYHDPYEKTS
jgi:hypothetical protein